MEVNRLVVPGYCCSIRNINKHVITGPCIVTGIRTLPILTIRQGSIPKRHQAINANVDTISALIKPKARIQTVEQQDEILHHWYWTDQ
jgi:hypothetical protein